MAAFVRLLGRPGIRDGARVSEPPAGKTTALLYYLAYRRDWVRREELLPLFYPEADETRARQNLRALVAKVRGSPWAGTVDVDRDRLRWAVPTDVAAFRAALEDGRLAAAVELYRGALLEGFVVTGAEAFQDWLEPERAALAGRWRAAALALGTELADQGRHAEAAEVAARLVAADALDEPAVRLRLRSLAEIGERAAALSLYRDFADMLRSQLDVDPESATRKLAERLRSGGERDEGGGPASLSPAAPPGPQVPGRSGRPLPPALTPFVGRQEELALLCARVDDPGCRLVTLVGPGGMGKTALALELARRLRDGGRDVNFVPLETVGDADAAVSLIGDAAGVTFFGTASRHEQVARALAARPGAVLVLDNVEQVGGVAELVTGILEGVAALTVITTSRAKLGLRSEWSVEVGGLGVDGPEGDEAASLFVGAARRADAGFDAARYRPEVQTICRLVGGMPLALELAAGWLPVLAPTEIADRLRAGFDLLTDESADRPARHGNVRGLLDGTWQALPASERRALEALSVFTGGFTTEAAREVAEVEPEALRRLAARALLVRNDDDRHTQHPLVWRYARERAALQPERWERTRARHAAYFAERMADVASLAEERPGERRTEETAELANVLQAWDWMIDRGRHDLLDQTLDGLHALAMATQRHVDVCRHVAAAEGAGGRGAFRARLLRKLGDLRIWSVDFERAFAPLHGALELAEQLGDRREEAMTLYDVGLARFFATGGPEESRETWERCVALFGEVGDRYHEASARINLADWEGDPGRREALQRAAVLGFRECRGAFGLTHALMNLALTLRSAHGDYAGAKDLLDEAIALERAGGVAFRLAWWFSDRAALLLDWGRTEEAERDVAEAERVAGALGSGFGVWEADHALLIRGLVRLAEGDPEGASEALARVARGSGDHPDPFGRRAKARCWWALAEWRAGRPDAAERLSREALTMEYRHGSAAGHEWWPNAVVPARVLFELLAGRDARAALTVLVEAWEAVTEFRLLPAALELGLATSRLLGVRGDVSGERTLLAAVLRHPAAPARVRRDARDRLVALGEPVDLAEEALDFDALVTLLTAQGLFEPGAGAGSSGA